MTTEIVNGNTTDESEIDQWIDRRSKFGNPFKISDFNQNMPDEAARELVVDLYSNYFNKRIRHDPQFREAVENLKNKKLACHCKPQLCHGDVLIRYLEGGDFKGGRWFEGPTTPSQNPSLPDEVNCPNCNSKAEQVDDGQLYKCGECGRETTRTQ